MDILTQILSTDPTTVFIVIVIAVSIVQVIRFRRERKRWKAKQMALAASKNSTDLSDPKLVKTNNVKSNQPIWTATKIVEVIVGLAFVIGAVATYFILAPRSPNLYTYILIGLFISGLIIALVPILTILYQNRAQLYSSGE